jgi:hypothetical protein
VDPISWAVVVSRFTMAVSIVASLLAAVSFAVTVSSHAVVSGSSGLATLFRILLPFTGQDPIIGWEPIGAGKNRGLIASTVFLDNRSEGRFDPNLNESAKEGPEVPHAEDQYCKSL